MSTLRKLIIATILIVSILVLWLLLVQRARIQRLPSNLHEAERGQAVEGFTLTDANAAMPSPQTNELLTVTSTKTPSGIASYNVSKMGNLPLREYCIKASYNSACTGTYVTLDMIKYVMSRGCRFLDFAVYYLETSIPTLKSDPNLQHSRQPCVAFSTDPTGISMTSKNCLLLTDVFQRVRDFAFQGPSPNTADPLFIQLRIYSGDKDAYQDVAGLIQRYFSRTQYRGKLDPATVRFADLAKNVVIVLDKNVIQDAVYQQTTLPQYVNLYSGGMSMLKYSPRQLEAMLAQPVQLVDSTQMSTVSRFIAVEPGPEAGGGSAANRAKSFWSWIFPSTANLDLSLTFFTENYGTQIVEYPFYFQGDQLVGYEAFFAAQGTAFVPFYLAIPYLQKYGLGDL